ncbi:hypothetical protein ACKVWL_003453 [Pyricularia oryzae]
MVTLEPIRDSVKKINETSWLIGHKHILRLIQKRPETCLWESSDGWCYVLDDAPATLPGTEPISKDGHARLIHDAGDASAVFDFGESLILKVKIAGAGPQEDETLAFLARSQLSFDIPTVLFHARYDDKTYLFEPRMPGKPLCETWWEMNADTKRQTAIKVAHICQELACFKSNVMTGTDYNWINPLREEPQDNTPETLKKHCEGLGMECSTFVFAHNDLGPTNILVKDNHQISIIDWDMAGYYPLEWVRTKFAVCEVLDVDRMGKNGLESDGEYRRSDGGIPGTERDSL